MTTVHLMLALLLASAPAGAQPGPPASPAAVSRPVTVESYYQAKWGSVAEFKRLYEKNEASLLREMQRLGFITELRIEEPFTHSAGEGRWSLRARITYRDAAAAVETGGAYDQAFAAARARLRPDKAAYEAEEDRRFSLLVDHWDVIVTAVE
jgi:hypothetical protein